MSNKFTAVYYVNKFGEEDGTFGHELLGLHALFESPYEEEDTIGEYSSAYDYVTEIALLNQSCGCWHVYITGCIDYHIDTWGDCDVDISIEYNSVEVIPIEMVVGDDEW
jgi:hypothetical protein